MSNGDHVPGPGVWRRGANGEWEQQRGPGDWVPYRPQQPTISQEAVDRLEQALEDGLALREQARVDAEKEKLRQDLTSELKIGHPTARLGEFLRAVGERRTSEQSAPAAPTKPTPTVEQALKEALTKKDEEAEENAGENR